MYEKIELIISEYKLNRLTKEKCLLELKEHIDKIIKQTLSENKALHIGGVSDSLLELKKYSIEEIEDYLDTIGYSVIKTTELDYLEERERNHPG